MSNLYCGHEGDDKEDDGLKSSNTTRYSRPTPLHMNRRKRISTNDAEHGQEMITVNSARIFYPSKVVVEGRVNGERTDGRGQFDVGQLTDVVTASNRSDQLHELGLSSNRYVAFTLPFCGAIEIFVTVQTTTL